MSLHSVVPVVALTLAAAVAGCDRGVPTPASSRAVASSGATASALASASAGAVPAENHLPPMNVILLVVDAMRYDMPWEGYKRPIAPNLTKLHEKSISFERGYAIASFTSKSVGGMLSGQYPSSLVRTSPFFTKYKDENEFMAEVLQQRGIRTLGVQAHMYLESVSGMHQGFDVWKMVPGIQWDYNKDPYITGPDHTKLINEIHADPKNTSGQFFAYYHYMDPHDVYNRHEIAPDFGPLGKDRYDEEIWFTDFHIQKMLDYVNSQPWGKRTAIIVTGDHGEAFGEHNFYKHAFELYEILVRVPLFFYLPGFESRRIARWRSHIDLVPTIYDLMGVPIPKGLPGKSLLPELKGEDVPQRPILCDLPADTYNVRHRALLDEEGYKLVALGKDRTFDLYNVRQDPEEKNNLIDVEKDRAKKMIERYKKLSDEIPFKKAIGGKVKEF